MPQSHTLSHTVVTLAALVVILAGIKAAASIIEPFLLSLFLAVIIAPMLQWLQNKGVGAALALALVIAVVLIVVLGLGMLIASSIQDFSNNLALYQSRLEERFAGLGAQMQAWGVALPQAPLAADSQKMMALASVGLKGLGSVVADSLVILFMVIFMLLEATHFTQKIRLIDAHEERWARVMEVAHKIKHYMVLKSLMSAATGALVWVTLWLFGLDYAVLWGVLAFFLNFVPNIGSLLAAVPAVLLAVVQLGFAQALWIALAYVAINTAIGSVIETKVMGKGLGLSTLVVFLSLIFWGWLLGPVGMLLSIPLTIMAKIACEGWSSTAWIAVMLGSGEEEELRA